jgi:hypothetical protein
VNRLGVLHEQPGAREACPQLCAHELVEARAWDGDAEEKEPEKHGQLVRVAEPSQVGRQLGRAGEELVAGREPVLDWVRLVARDPQQAGKLDGRLRALRPRRIRTPGRRDGTDGLWLGGRSRAR